ncbi:50S ribosomal protein L22 [Criblamydia sequanensis]|uniref:Large ribosomal subunit protein uL22 n=1 Tax=Candidatus Criblamydia sequanensis CRIB-18 TaxID=1437425 RepID=A0A090D0F6_9BACT|nr:50S ribosomal protein L22 [Criblamydia sequanensis]CDR33058.1 50S ribosomal protein L22 [Criblamydia sequanensis CRIB-18]
MALAKAVSKYIRISPRKVRVVAGIIKNMPVDAASFQLKASNLKGGRLLKKTLDSAVANAEINHDLKREELKVIEVRVDEGPRLKRARSRSKGGRHPILKRTSHLTVIVGKE